MRPTSASVSSAARIVMAGPCSAYPPDAPPDLAYPRELEAARPSMRQHGARDRRFRTLEPRVVLEPRHRLVARGGEQPGVAQQVRDPEGRQAGLPRAEEVAGTTLLEIRFGDAEAVRRPLEHAEPLVRLLRHPAADGEEAVAPVRPAPDPAAQLMELRQAEALGVLHHDDRRVRDVDADLDHGR